MNIVRKKRDSGKDSFELTAEKSNKLHDDRAYTAAMLSYALMHERRKNIIQKKKAPLGSLTEKFIIKSPKKIGNF